MELDFSWELLEVNFTHGMRLTSFEYDVYTLSWIACLANYVIFNYCYSS